MVLVMTDDFRFFRIIRKVDEQTGQEDIRMDECQPQAENFFATVYIVPDVDARMYRCFLLRKQENNVPFLVMETVCSFIPRVFLTGKAAVVVEYVPSVPSLLIDEGYLFDKAMVFDLEAGRLAGHYLTKEPFCVDVFLNAKGNLMLESRTELKQFTYAGGCLTEIPVDFADLDVLLPYGVEKPEVFGFCPEDFREIF